VEVTNADKMMFPDPGYTKADLVGYYDAVADRMLPWLDGRPLTLERHPDGVGSKGFMQKHASAHFSDRIERTEVPKSGGTVTHPVVRDREGLLELANQGTITFHVWTAALPDLDHPSHLVLDLDPDAEDLGGVRQVALAARELLHRFDVEGLPVASGKKGFHIWVPITGHDYAESGLASRAMASLIAAELPEIATVEFRKKNRHGRVFVDWLRNGRAQSIVCPWSLRTTPLATVATPLDWNEVVDAVPSGWTLRSAPGRTQPETPGPFRLDMDQIVGAARGAGADLDSEFDRFGRS
jgi:bifunctional non-homologous end joining protein LigD